MTEGFVSLFCLAAREGEGKCGGVRGVQQRMQVVVDGRPGAWQLAGLEAAELATAQPEVRRRGFCLPRSDLGASIVRNGSVGVAALAPFVAPHRGYRRAGT
jgi:hypothetical protein